MKDYKLRIFKRAILARMEAEQATREEILASYPRLTETEKQALREVIPETIDEGQRTWGGESCPIVKKRED